MPALFRIFKRSPAWKYGSQIILGLGLLLCLSIITKRSFAAVAGTTGVCLVPYDVPCKLEVKLHSAASKGINRFSARWLESRVLFEAIVLIRRDNSVYNYIGGSELVSPALQTRKCHIPFSTDVPVK